MSAERSRRKFKAVQMPDHVEGYYVMSEDEFYIQAVSDSATPFPVIEYDPETECVVRKADLGRLRKLVDSIFCDDDFNNAKLHALRLIDEMTGPTAESETTPGGCPGPGNPNPYDR